MMFGFNKEYMAANSLSKLQGQINVRFTSLGLLPRFITSDNADNVKDKQYKRKGTI